jgi:hypothetical protein
VTSQSFTASFSVDQTPDEVFKAITNVRGWWTGDLDGSTEKVGDEFTYRYQDLHYSKQKVTELIPGKKVMWRVLDAHLKFAEDPREWAGTDITFDVAHKNERTEVRFAHLGLTTELECYDSCSDGWSFYINRSLQRLITTGEGPTTPPWA